MNDPHPPDPDAPIEAQGDATPDRAEGEPAPPTPPEPWTPKRVREWNSYYDLYIVAGVLLLAFVASANRVDSSPLWSQLQVGRLIAEQGRPLTTEPFSMTERGKPWANVGWLADLGHWQLFRAARGLAPADPDSVARAARADQIGVGALIGATALTRALAALALLSIRRRGPGLWWSAVCVALALGVMIKPSRIGLGGIAEPATPGPEAWGILLLALELAILFRAIDRGRSGWAWALPPLFAVWANTAESFPFGLAILAAAALGRLRPGQRIEGAPGSGRLAAILAASAAACLANPSTYRAFVAALEPFANLVAPATEGTAMDEISFFGPGIRMIFTEGEYTKRLVYYFGLVGLGVGSFVLNRARFSIGRFLAFAIAAAAWGLFYRFGREFAVVFAATMALNGQEWYLDRYGDEGRLGRGWSVWSIGGRAITIVLVFAAITKGVTGYGARPGEPIFGFGFSPSDFPFEAADYLRSAQVGGAVLNTVQSQGDALIWRAQPVRKPYVDGRRHVYPGAIRAERQELRRALAEDNLAVWKPILDKHGVSAVMIDASAPKTIERLSRSPNWIPFYDDGATLIFGRADAPEADAAFFRGERLDADELAYKRPKPSRPVSLPPTPWSPFDQFLPARSLLGSQPHNESAGRWLQPASANPASVPIPDPARCLLAIREARASLAADPNDTLGFRRLVEAYRYLMLQESALLAGIAPTPENVQQIRQVVPQSGALLTRFRQRVTALQYAIQTSPRPENPVARAELRQLNLELGQMFLSLNYLDLARDRLEAGLELGGTLATDGPFATDPQVRASLSQDVAKLDAQVAQVEEQLTALSLERQAGPIERAEFALSAGAPGLAIRELKEAENSGLNPALYKPLLLDLYCQSGQPDMAIPLLGNVDDPTLGKEAGTSAYRNGMVSLLIGNYQNTAALWANNAIRQLRQELSLQGIFVGQSTIRGNVKEATSTVLQLPGKVRNQASWEFDLAICLLEAGEPVELVAEHFTNALTLDPDLATRPVAAYYLEKLGKPVPPATPAETPTP